MKRRRLLASLLGLLLVGAVLLTLAEAHRRSQLYWYDVRADYRYEFASPPRSVAIDAAGFSIESVDPASTVILGMSVASTVAGRWFEPSLEITGPDGSTRTQFFERGARGLRWIELSGLLDAEGGRVELRGRHLSWKAQQASWVESAPPRLEAGPLLILAPHPDDAEIAAFGLYSSHDSWIVTVTSGHGADGRWKHLVPDPRERALLYGQTRAFDSVAVPRWGGVPPGRAVNLGYFTVTLDEMYADPNGIVADAVLGDADIAPFRRVEGSERLENREAVSSWASLVDDLAEIVQAVQPATIVTPDPRLDGAADHKLTTIALFEALERVGPAGRALLLYTNHPPTSEYFPFGPAHGVVGLPPWTGGPLWARGVLSHRLDDARRVRKLMALEAQHDLRPAPRYATTSPFRRVFGELTRTLGALWRDPADSYSYLRRGPRPNELFLVYEEVDAGRLREDVAGFLRSLREGQPAPAGESAPAGQSTPVGEGYRP